MNKTISMSIRVSEEELDKLKQAARLESYVSYSEFIRRTALIEAESVLKKKNLYMNEEEKLYLMMHVNRLCTREDCNRKEHNPTP